MAWEFHILVVANVTADSSELIEALTERASKAPCAFTLVVPAPAGGRIGREAAQERLASALDAMRSAGLAVDGQVGDQDPIAAVHEAWDPTPVRRGRRLHPARPARRAGSRWTSRTASSG